MCGAMAEVYNKGACCPCPGPTRVWFPASTHMVAHMLPSSGLLGYCMHMVHRHMQAEEKKPPIHTKGRKSKFIKLDIVVHARKKQNKHKLTICSACSAHALNNTAPYVTLNHRALAAFPEDLGLTPSICSSSSKGYDALF